MKFQSIIFVCIGVFVASTYADCNCDLSDQTCLTKCVTTANACIVKCEAKGDACQQDCIANNWPSYSVVQKEVLNEKINNSTTDSSAKVSVTGSEFVSATHSASAALNSGSKSVAVSSSTGAKPSVSPKNNSAEASSTSDSVHQLAMAWSVTLAAAVGTIAYIF